MEFGWALVMDWAGGKARIAERMRARAAKRGTCAAFDDGTSRIAVEFLTLCFSSGVDRRAAVSCDAGLVIWITASPPLAY
jgi:hypothetical protein